MRLELDENHVNTAAALNPLVGVILRLINGQTVTYLMEINVCWNYCFFLHKIPQFVE